MSDVKLYLGDCLDILPTLPKVDAVITDIPYGTTQCSWDAVIPFDVMWRELYRVCNRVAVLFGSQPFTSQLISSNIKNFKYEWIWNKKLAGNAMLSDYQPLKTHENICVFSLGEGGYYPIMRKGKVRTKLTKAEWNGAFGKQKSKPTRNGDYKPISILTVPVIRKDRVHPTQKPVALLKYLVETYSRLGDTVLDFTMGSGTTGVACVQTGRNFIGIEIDPDYYAIAEKRIDEAKLQIRMSI